MDSNKENLLLENVHTLLQTVEQMKHCLEEVSNASRELITILERKSKHKAHRGSNFRKQMIHRKITDRPPTPIAREMTLSTSSTKSTSDWVKPPPEAKGGSNIGKDQDFKEEIVPKTDDKEKKEKEWIFPPLVLKRKAKTVQQETKEIDESKIPMTPMTSSMPAIQEDDSNEEKKVASISENWMCRYVKREYDPFESVPQTMAYIDDSFMNPSVVSVACSLYNFKNEPRPVIDDANKWMSRYKTDPCQSTVKNVSCNTTSSEVSLLPAVSVQPDVKKHSSNRSSNAESVLSLPSVEEHPVSVMVEQIAETRESSWCTISDDNQFKQPKIAAQLKSTELEKFWQTSKATGKQLKRLKPQQLRGRLAILGTNLDSRQPSSCCKHTLYCISCGHQFKVQHAALPRQSRKLVRSGLVSRLVDKWENVNNKRRK